MKIIKLDQSQYKQHNCTSTREGDIIRFTCIEKDCNYVRKFNYKTGKMKVTGGDSHTLHKGIHDPFRVSEIKSN